LPLPLRQRVHAADRRRRSARRGARPRERATWRRAHAGPARGPAASRGRMKSRATASTAPAEPAAFGTRPVGPLTWAIVALALLVAGVIFGQRLHRPLEQGGDAYSDANAMLA